MKRTLIPVLALCLLLAACGVEQTPVETLTPAVPASDTPGPVSPSPEPASSEEPKEDGIIIPETPYSYLTFENEWLTLRDAYSGAMEAYEWDAWHSCLYGHGSILLFEPKETLTDVSFCTTEMDEDGNYTDGEVFCTLDDLTPEEPLVLEVTFYGSMTAYGMSFTDASGGTHRLLLTMGGRGPDEACPYSLTAY